MSIATKAVTGAAWNLVAGIGSRLVALVGTLVLTRFIAPAEYGEIAVATVTVVTAMTVTDVMVSQSIVARRVGPDACFHAFVVHVCTGVVGLGAVLLLAPRLGSYFDAPGMARYVPGFALAALLERVAHVPNRLLVRDMRFRTVAVTRGSAEVVFTAVSLALAPSMHGSAIVIGNLARQALMAAVYLTRVDRREWWVPQRLRWAPIRDLLVFGLPLSAACLADVVSANWDNLLVARFFGASTAGAYRLSRSLADTPMTNVAEHIGDVLLPSFVLMDAGRRNDAVVRSSAIISLIVAPLSVGLAAVAPTLVPAIFDRRWAGMAPMLVVLSALGLVRPVTWPLASFLQAQQRPRALMFLSFLRAAAMVLFLVTVGRLGPAWACLAVGLGQIANGAASLAIAQRSEGLSSRDFLAGVSRPALAAAVMFAAVTALRLGLPTLGVRGAWSLLALEVIAGAAVYLAAALVLARSTVDDALQLLRRGMRRRTA